MEYKFGDPDDYGDFPYLYCGQWSDDNLNEILQERLPDTYNMQLVDPDEVELIAVLTKQGIDSHLEAITFSKHPRLVNVKAGDQVIFQKAEFIPDKDGMTCLIRRLREYLDTCDDDLQWEVAYNLLSCVFETLQIEYSV